MVLNSVPSRKSQIINSPFREPVINWNELWGLIIAQESELDWGLDIVLSAGVVRVDTI